MTDDSERDLNTFPTDIEIPATLTADQPSEAEVAADQMPEFPFCVLFAGRPWRTVTVKAPSPDAAAMTVDQWVRQVLNPTAVRLGYPPNIISWSAGACG